MRPLPSSPCGITHHRFFRMTESLAKGGESHSMTALPVPNLSLSLQVLPPQGPCNYDGGSWEIRNSAACFPGACFLRKIPLLATRKQLSSWSLVFGIEHYIGMAKKTTVNTWLWRPSKNAFMVPWGGCWKCVRKLFLGGWINSTEPSLATQEQADFAARAVSRE